MEKCILKVRKLKNIQLEVREKGICEPLSTFLRSNALQCSQSDDLHQDSIF